MGKTILRKREKMSKEKDQKAERTTEVAGAKPVSAPADPKSVKDASAESNVQPEIALFLADPKVSPSAFFKAVKKVKRFKKDDEERAQAVLSEDLSGERLWALMSQSSLPAAVDLWIWPVVLAQLKNAVGKDFNPLDSNPAQVLQSLRRAFAPRLESKEQVERKVAENWLRIGICWLTEKKSIDFGIIAEVISATYFKDAKKARYEVKRAIGKGSIKEFKLSIANIRLGNDNVARAKSDLAEERHISNDLRTDLTDAEKKIKDQKTELATLRTQLSEKNAELKNVQTQLENERHHWGHDLSETKAGQRVLLGERVAPLLSDAIDALEIEPPVPSIALKRVKTVLKVIEEASS